MLAEEYNNKLIKKAYECPNLNDHILARRLSLDESHLETCIFMVNYPRDNLVMIRRMIKQSKFTHHTEYKKVCDEVKIVCENSEALENSQEDSSVSDEDMRQEK